MLVFTRRDNERIIAVHQETGDTLIIQVRRRGESKIEVTLGDDLRNFRLKREELCKNQSADNQKGDKSDDSSTRKPTI